MKTLEYGYFLTSNGFSKFGRTRHLGARINGYRCHNPEWFIHWILICPIPEMHLYEAQMHIKMGVTSTGLEWVKGNTYLSNPLKAPRAPQGWAKISDQHLIRFMIAWDEPVTMDLYKRLIVQI